MDAGLVVDELASKMQAALAPGKPKLIAGNREQHRPHTEIQPARCIQRPHAGIHKRQSRASFRPSRQAIAVTLPQAGGEGMELNEFQARLAFQLLDEMAMPVQSLIKPLQGAPPGSRREALAT